LSKPIIIGTRGSDLALWQANKVKCLLETNGYKAELSIIHSTGDKDRKAKLHEMGLVGVFTKELDDSLLLKEIDIAVHSLKDVPTRPPKGIIQGAVLARANPYDVLIKNGKSPSHENFILATGSLRRRAFWSHKYTSHRLKDLRGNVPTRLEKLSTEELDGIILAKAGLDRLDISPDSIEILDWMVPAPAQGIVGVFCLESNSEAIKALKDINHRSAEICAYVERDLLKTLEGGCTAPIGAHCVLNGDELELTAALLSPDGKKLIKKQAQEAASEYKALGSNLAKEILKNGGKEIMNELNKGNELPRVLCLKKLTPPRIKIGIEHGLALDSVEVIQTVTDFDSLKVKELLKSSNNYIFSSLNSVSALNKVLKGTAMIHKHVYCVGKRTAHFFEGKVKSITKVNQVSDLLKIAQESGEKKFSWFHSNLSDLSLVEQFLEYEIELNHTPVYRTEGLEPRINNLADYDALLFFSPSGVRSFLTNNSIPKDVKVGAIGNVTAEELKDRTDFIPSEFEFESLLKTTKFELSK